MIVVFDLDDTLYPELSYVKSGFRAVAAAAAAAWGVDADQAAAVLERSLAEHGRGQQFDALGRAYGHEQRRWVRHFVKVYRHHAPQISLPRHSRELLEALGDRPLYLVTDGHKIVQQRKVEALGLEPWFRRVYLTNRYGIAHQKPSPRVFELIVARERCSPAEVVYIGDNPRKDFCGIRPLGFRTIRVRQGNHAAVEVPAAQDAELEVSHLREVLAQVKAWEQAACDKELQ